MVNDYSEEVFKMFMMGQNSTYGVAIKNCIGTEVMTITRYGGDIKITIFDYFTDEILFEFLAEMTKNHWQYWKQIFGYFAKIKAKLVQK